MNPWLPCFDCGDGVHVGATVFEERQVPHGKKCPVRVCADRAACDKRSAPQPKETPVRHSAIRRSSEVVPFNAACCCAAAGYAHRHLRARSADFDLDLYIGIDLKDEAKNAEMNRQWAAMRARLAALGLAEYKRPWPAGEIR